ncbi:protein of unknown function (DUF4371) [Popillia japonica]|uniref:DUF4371 domain-containing protein n=1 Tax=Popillia japonica TaxID=7064 RepID=A0AAW1ME05_POPJA
MQSLIVKKIEKSRFYSVLADVTTDISRIEQFSLCIRYVDKDEDGMKLREDYLTFVPVHDLAWAALAGTLKETLVSLGLNLNNLRGQGHDGASAMTGSFRGVQSIIREEYPRTIYTHCASHCLNLCLSDASKVTSIRNAFGTINEVCRFLRSAKRSNILKNRLKVLKEESNKNVSSLIKYCETRWVESGKESG